MLLAEVQSLARIIVLLSSIIPLIGCEQSPRDQGLSITDEVEQLKKNQVQLVTDIAEIKKLLLQRSSASAPASTPKITVIDLKGISFLGQDNAPLTMIEYTDYHCPFCRRHAQNTLPKLFKKYIDTGKLRYGIRDFPQASLHPDAYKLSEAALCAGDQGKYWQMHHQFMKGSGNADPNKLTENAVASELDIEQFNKCMDSNQHESDIRDALVSGQGMGIRGTPYFFIGATDPNNPEQLSVASTVRGAQPYSVFKSHIEKLVMANVVQSENNNEDYTVQDLKTERVIR